MKGIFCHDLPIYKDINGIYCSTTLTNDLFRRYFKIVDKLVVATRVYKLKSTYKEAHQERITLPNIEFLEFDNLNKSRYIFSRLPRAYIRLKQEIKSCDMVFIRGGIIALLAGKACLSMNKPYLVEVAGCAWDEYWNHSLTGKIIAPYMEYEVKKIVKKASFAIYVTEKWLQNRYPTEGKSTHASNVILKEVDENVLVKRLKKINSTDKSKKIVIGTTGCVNNKNKGQHFVIKAMNELKGLYDIQYDIIGGGSKEFLENIAKKYRLEEKVIFRGEMNHNEVLSWLDSLDIYIQPSMQEGLPRALLEAMSRGCPAIGSTTGGIPELLDQKTIFERGSTSSLLNVFIAFMKKDWNIFAKNNFNKAKEYRLDVLDERREKIYKEYMNFVLNRKNEKMRYHKLL